MRAYGIDRKTNDLDLWVARDRSNAQALTRFMRNVQNMPPLERLQQPNFKFTVGDPARPEVDILTSVAGDPSFNDALTRCQRLMLDTRRVPVIDVADLIYIKTSSALHLESETDDLTLSEADRAQAAGTAEKERHDIELLQVWVKKTEEKEKCQ